MKDEHKFVIELLLKQYKHLPTDTKEVSVSYRYEKWSKQKSCFNNVFKALNFNANIIYVLGFTFIHDVPVEHAWLKEDGNYFDITFETENHTYISVVEFTLNDIYPFVEKYMLVPCLYDMNKFLGEKLSQANPPGRATVH